HAGSDSGRKYFRGGPVGEYLYGAQQPGIHPQQFEHASLRAQPGLHQPIPNIRDTDRAMRNLRIHTAQPNQRRFAVRVQREKGVALITALLILLLVSAIVVGMSWMVMTDQRLGGNNQSRESAFYGAEAGMEQLTSDVGTTFSTNGKLTPTDIATITSTPPVIPGIQFVNGSGTSSYQITFVPDAFGNPLASNSTILPPSPSAGMQGLITPFTLTVSARTTATGSEVK